jgi:peptide/nickel transport system ATP-binding protein
MTDEAPLLETENLKRYFDQDTGFLDAFLGGGSQPVQAVDGVSLALYENDSIGIIGESGCGKTTLLQTLARLQEQTDGELRFEGNPISEFSKKEMKAFRRQVQIIFQDPFNSFDPKLTVRESLLEPLRIHGMDDRDRRVREALERAELNPPEKYLERRPTQLSGGELQRVSIARALVLEPKVILADEPVSMLDVSTQASILNLLSDLTAELDVALLYISHDLSTVSYVCDRIDVMYLGRVVESAPTHDLLDSPKHPYTQALVNAIPIPDPHDDRERTTIDGTPGNPVGIGEGCRFRDRCPERMDICERTPRNVSVDTENHRVACHLYYDHEEEQRRGEAIVEGQK